MCIVGPFLLTLFGGGCIVPSQSAHVISKCMQHFQITINIHQTISGWWFQNPSEKWWSSSVGVMTFPTEWKVIKFMFQTTNQYHHFGMIPLINHDSRARSQWGRYNLPRSIKQSGTFIRPFGDIFRIPSTMTSKNLTRRDRNGLVCLSPMQWITVKIRCYSPVL